MTFAMKHIRGLKAKCIEAFGLEAFKVFEAFSHPIGLKCFEAQMPRGL